MEDRQIYTDAPPAQPDMGDLYYDSAQTLTVTNTVTTSQAGATIENQDAILKMLQLILEKVTVNREAVRP